VQDFDNNNEKQRDIVGFANGEKDKEVVSIVIQRA